MKQLLQSLFVTSIFVAMLPPAVAQPRSADDLYKEGEKHYNLGQFERAIDAFKAAYGVTDRPAYLYNIAQAYRQLGDCKNAVFFYRRFISLKAQDTARPLKPELKAEIDGRIIELEACAKNAEAIKNRPPDQIRPDGEGDGRTGTGTGTGDRIGTGTGAGTGTGTGAPGNGGSSGTGTEVAGGGDDDDDDDDSDDDDVVGGVTASVFESPKLVALRLTGGAAKIGAGDLDVPVQFSVALTGGYPLAVAPNFTVELGAGFTFTPLPYDRPAGETGSATLISLLANVGASYALTPKIELHADLGLGALMFGGLELGNPFTENGSATTGALTMFNLRVAASIGYAVTPNFLVVGTPLAFSYSPAKAGLMDSISALTRLDFMLGVGYRM